MIRFHDQASVDIGDEQRGGEAAVGAVDQSEVALTETEGFQFDGAGDVFPLGTGCRIPVAEMGEIDLQ